MHNVKSVNGLNWILVCKARSKWKIVVCEQKSQNIFENKTLKEEERP